MRRPVRTLPLALVFTGLAFAGAGRADNSAPSGTPTAATPAAVAAPRTLHLADAVELATSDAPAAVLAKLRERETAAKVGQSRAAFLPSLAGTASYLNRTYNLAAQGIPFPLPPGTKNEVGPIDGVDARVHLGQTLFDFAAWRRLTSSRAGARAGTADRGSSNESSAQAAALAYLRAARADAVAAARNADLALARELADLAQAQETAGTSPHIDVTRALTAVASAKGDAIVARNQRDRALIDLARTLGLDPTAPPGLADTLSAALGASDAPAKPEDAVAFALERRPELKGEHARVDKARDDRGATQAERIPRLEAAADWGKNGLALDEWIPTREVSVGLTWPLVDGLRRESRIAEQTSLLEQAQVRERDLHDQIAAEVQAALLDLSSGVEQQGVSAERLALAQEGVSEARERFEQGVANNIEVITAQVSLNRARDADIDARYAVASARVALARASGVAGSLR